MLSTETYRCRSEKVCTRIRKAKKYERIRLSVIKEVKEEAASTTDRREGERSQACNYDPRKTKKEESAKKGSAIKKNRKIGEGRGLSPTDPHDVGPYSLRKARTIETIWGLLNRIELSEEREEKEHLTNRDGFRRRSRIYKCKRNRTKTLR